jgi:hypothetical protein
MVEIQMRKTTVKRTTAKKATFKTIDIDLTPSEFNKIAKAAHKKDITFNQMCILLLEEFFKDYEYNPEKALAKIGLGPNEVEPKPNKHKLRNPPRPKALKKVRPR